MKNEECAWCFEANDASQELKESFVGNKKLIKIANFSQ